MNKAPTFKDFWKAYPRKRGKDKAELAWKRMTAVERRLALSAIPDYIDDYQKNNVIFMYPQGWLNQKRWRDYVEQDEDGTPPQGVAPQPPCAPLKRGAAKPDPFAQPEPQAAPSLDDMEGW